MTIFGNFADFTADVTARRSATRLAATSFSPHSPKQNNLSSSEYPLNHNLMDHIFARGEMRLFFFARDFGY